MIHQSFADLGINSTDFITIPQSHYSINPEGVVKNNITGVIIKPWINTKGYFCVSINIGNKKKHKFLHRLIAETFITNPGNKPCVDHIDTNKENNSVSNLRWCTHKENTNNPITLQRLRRTFFKCGDLNPKTMLGNKGHKHPSSKPVVQFDSYGNIIKEYENSGEASELLNIDRSSINRCCNGKRKTAGGFCWKFK